MSVIRSGLVIAPHGSNVDEVVDDLEQLFRQLGRAALLFQPWSASPEYLIEEMLDVYSSLLVNSKERYQCFPTADSFRHYLELDVGTPTNSSFFRRRILQRGEYAAYGHKSMRHDFERYTIHLY